MAEEEKDQQSLEADETEEQKIAPEEEPEQGEKTEGERPEQESPRKEKDWAYWNSEYKREKRKRQERDQIIQQLQTRLTSFDEAKPKSKLALEGVNTLEQFRDYLMEEVNDQLGSQLGEREMDQRQESSEGEARKAHDGSDGLPEYDELIDEYVNPLIEKQPIILDLLRQLPGPGEAAYTLGLLIRYPTVEKLSALFKAQGREEVLKKIDDSSKQGLRLKGQKKEGAKPGAEDIMNWTPEKTEQEIAKVTGKI